MKPATFVPNTAPQRGAVAWGFCLVRWMLVGLLVVDQIGAPFHHHHHDFGIDALSIGAAVEQGHESIEHAEDVDRPASFGHATLAIRSASEGRADFGFTPAADADDSSVLFIASLVALALTSAEKVAAPHAYETWRAPPIPVHRSLPPAGRAPPLHA